MIYRFLFIMCLFISCGSLSKQDMYGTYKSIDNGFMTSLTLYDSIFEYQHQGHLISSKSKGKWKKVKDNKILLESDLNYKVNFLEVKESLDSNKEGYIQIFDSDGVPYYKISVIINDTVTLYTDIDGKVFINKYPPNIQSIQLGVLGVSFPNNTYKVKNDVSNIFIITAKEVSNEKIYFDNLNIRVRKNKLYIDNQVLRKE